VSLGAKVVRVSFPIATPASALEPTIAGYAALGVRVLPLAEFDGRIPSSAEARGLAAWAQAYGPGGSFWAGRSDGWLAVESIEFGNETSYSYQYPDNSPSGYAARAQSYALAFAEAANAIRAANPAAGLLAQGDSGNAGTIWMENMFKAVPNLGSLVAGWTMHPYGLLWHPRLEALLQETAAEGAPSSIPIDITEWGVSSDNGRCLSENYGYNPCMTYQEAGETLRTVTAGMRKLLGERLGLFLFYQVRDRQPSGASSEREGYFGVLQHELQGKGLYTTAAQEVLAG
jgi:hypothetical protein